MSSISGKINFSFIVVILFIMSIGFTACNDENFSTNSKYQLSFSNDTLNFDTVFTTLGSATSKIMIYNHNNVALKISHIGVAGGKTSSFKINVDGSINADNQFNDIEIRAKDSMYVFVSVTVNPTNANSPVIIKDSLVLQTNGVLQNVKLQAYGQNIIILRGKRYNDDTILKEDLPYLVYDSLIVSQNKTLTLNPGCKIYFHNNANLKVYGNLNAIGTAEKPIIMRGDRLDKIKFATPFPYNNIAGQWDGVYLLGKDGKHVLRHVNMNSGYVGIYFSNNDRNANPNLEISDCRIQNFYFYGLVVQNGNVQVVNTEISNTSSYSVYLSGGKHSFIQCTIANYFDNSTVEPISRDKKPAVMIMNLNRVSPMETVFRNCVISGNEDNEFSLASRFLDQYKGIFDHCYIKKADSLKLPQFTKIRWAERKDTIFKSTRYNLEENTYFNFMPDSVSPVRGLADPNVAAQYPLDLNGKSRLSDGAPDAGAYEWQPTK
ncbi:MAG: hypothetical protein PHT07_03430 [Paludibacter sp.]|nr:hypothetical protein [Paludibacter sp.]